MKDRVIGHVVWVLSIVATPPHQYTQDVCVIKLDKDEFRYFRRNVPSLDECWPVSMKASNLTVHVSGLEIFPANFKRLMYDRFDAPHEFVHSPEGLFEL